MIRMLSVSLLALVSVVAASVAHASDEAVEVVATPVVVESLNFQYGEAQFGWQRIRTDDFQLETNQDGDIRFGPRGNLAEGVHARLLAKLHGGKLTEVRPELILSEGDWYTMFSVGIDTKTGEASLYDETVFTLGRDRNFSYGLGLVHNGGLSGQKSTLNIGPQLGIQLSKELSLDLHYGLAVTKNTPDEAWAIMRFKVQ